MSEFFYGIMGFAGFEALRIYKRLWADLPIVPVRRYALYLATISFLAGFSGAVANALSDGNIAEALFVGFSVPTGLKSLLEAPHPSKGPVVDDVVVETPSVRQAAWMWIRSFFRFT